MRTLVMMCVAGMTLLGLPTTSSGQRAFDDAVLQAVQSAVIAKTHWQGTRVTPMEGSSPNMVITQWTSKTEHGVVMIYLWQVESQSAALTHLRGHAASFDGKARKDIGDEAYTLVRGGIAFRRGLVVASVSAVAFQLADHHKPDHEQEIALCVRFAKAVDSGLRLAYGTNP
jgi:hypothetical protein